MCSVIGAFAEFERALIKERQREGIALAKQRGAYQGRTQVLSAAQATELRRRGAAGEQKATLARAFGISRETLYHYRKRYAWPLVRRTEYGGWCRVAPRSGAGAANMGFLRFLGGATASTTRKRLCVMIGGV